MNRYTTSDAATGNQGLCVWREVVKPFSGLIVICDDMLLGDL